MDKIEEGIALIQEDAEALTNCAEEHGVKMNFKKIKVMIMGSKKFTDKIDLNELPKKILQGQPLTYAEEVTNLGLKLTPNLNYENHVKHITRKIHGMLHSLRFYKHALSKPLKKKLVESLIFPHFDYLSAVYNHLDKDRDLKIQRLQNACVRFVFGNIPARNHVTPYRFRLKWLSAKHRREYLSSSIAFTSLSHKNPFYLIERFNKVTNRPYHLKSRPRTFDWKNARTEAWQNSFTIKCSSLINDLPILDFHPDNITTFKKNLLTELINRDKNEWNQRVLNEGIVLSEISK